MTLEIRINPRDLAALHRKLEPKQYAKILFDICAKAAKWGAEDVQSQHWDLGAIARSTLFENTSFGARVVTRAPGARAIEGGRGAGARAPSAGALQEWASRHGLAGLEFVIARAIARRGIRGRFFMKRTKQRLHELEIPLLIHDAVGEIHAISPSSCWT